MKQCLKYGSVRQGRQTTGVSTATHFTIPSGSGSLPGRPATGFLDGPLIIVHRLVHTPCLLMEQGEHSVAAFPAGRIERRGLQVAHDRFIDIAEFILG